MTDVKTCLNEAQDKMDMATMYLEESLAHIRAGKADTRLLDGIRVDSYGSMVPINNVASVTTPVSSVLLRRNMVYHRRNIKNYTCIPKMLMRVKRACAFPLFFPQSRKQTRL